VKILPLVDSFCGRQITVFGTQLSVVKTNDFDTDQVEACLGKVSGQWSSRRRAEGDPGLKRIIASMFCGLSNRD